MPFILTQPSDRTVFHEGELEIQRRYRVADLARELQTSIVPRLGAGHTRFIDRQSFFFICMLGADGLPVAQVVPRVEVPEGVYPLLAITAAETFYFMLSDTTAGPLCAASQHGAGKAGLIFVDFNQRARLRINGRVQWERDPAAQGFQCPAGHRLMRVDVEQVYANCNARIVKMQVPTDAKATVSAPSSSST